MSRSRTLSAGELHRRHRVTIVLAIAAIALLTVFGCVTRTMANEGLEVSVAAADSTAAGEMIVSPAARALGQRIIRFGNRGTPAEHVARREGAGRAMATTCAGAYLAGSEGPTATDGVVTPHARGAELEPSDYWYMQFRCVQDTPSPAGRA
jgi:hypothetical protein